MYKSYKDALEHLRHSYLGKKLSYREMAELLTAHSGYHIHKSHVWNAMKRARRCPKRIRIGLENMDLLECKPRRWRFFYEVADEEEYNKVKNWLDEQDIDFKTITDWSLMLIMSDVLPIERIRVWVQD